jgi:hypothetical protein
MSYQGPAGDAFGISSYRTEKSVSGLPSDSDREKQTVLPEGSATPKSVKPSGMDRSLPEGHYNGPASGSGVPDRPRTKGVPGDQYGTPYKNDYNMLTRRTMTARIANRVLMAAMMEVAGTDDLSLLDDLDDDSMSDVMALTRQRRPYRSKPRNFRLHTQRSTNRRDRSRRYRQQRSKERAKHKQWYRRVKNNPAFKRRRQDLRKNPMRHKKIRSPRPTKRHASVELNIPILMGPNLVEGWMTGVSPDGRVWYESDNGEQAGSLSATAFLRAAVFEDDDDVEDVVWAIDQSDADEPYGELTHQDVVDAAAMHDVVAPVGASPEAEMDQLMQSVVAMWDMPRMAHDTILYDQQPPSELSNNWMNREQPTREVPDTGNRPYKENAPDQWTRTRMEPTHEPTPPGFVEPNEGYFEGGSGKVIPDNLKHAAIRAAMGRL